MKKFIALLVLSMASAFAAEVQIMDEALPMMTTFNSTVDARLQVDKTTGQGSVAVTVTEQRWTDMGTMCDQWGRCYPNRVNMPYIVFSKSVDVEGLALHGDQVIYAGEAGDVNCGRLGESSVLRRPTIYLSGNCKLTGKVTGNWHSARVNVIMTTK